MTANTIFDFNGREFARVVEERQTNGRPIFPREQLLDILLHHSAPDQPIADRTPITDPHHDVVGQEFAGSDWQDPEWRGKRWFCFSHDALGYWMYATDGSGHWTSVSEQAIGRSFHPIHKEPGGRIYCGWYRSGVPSYVGQSFVRHKSVVVT